MNYKYECAKLAEGKLLKFIIHYSYVYHYRMSTIQLHYFLQI
jgi:hypothetical protein